MNKRKWALMLVGLLLCFSVLVSVGFAWVSLSRAPEITEIDIYIGAVGEFRATNSASGL